MKNMYVMLAFFGCCVMRCSSVLAPEASCESDAECPEFYLCEGSPNSICTHKSIFPNTTSRELGGIFISIIANSISNSCGIGAGALIVPYLTLLNNFTPNAGIILTYAIVFGGGIGAVLGIISKKNPMTGGPLIVYSIDMLCIPCLMGGVPIGILLNKVLAPIVVDILLFCLLLFSIIKIAQKFKETLKKERQIARDAKIMTQEQRITLEIETQQQAHEEETPVENENRPREQENVANNPLNSEPQAHKGKSIKLENSLQEERSSKKKELKQNPSHLAQADVTENARSSRVFVNASPGDSDDVEDELYELGFNNVLTLIGASDPQKIVDENREIERRHTLERKKSLEDKEKGKNEKDGEAANKTQPVVSEADKKLIEKIRRRELHRFPLEKVAVIFLSLVIYVIINLIIGTSKFNSITNHISYCSVAYWGLWALLILFQIGVYILAACLILKWQKEKEKVGWEFRPEDVKINRKRAVVIFLVSFLGGILGGLLALGGALVIAPFFLSYSVPPQPLAASTTVFMIFTQFCTLIIAILTNSYTTKDLIFLLFISAALSYLFSRSVGWFVKKTKKQSIILGILVVMLAIAFIANLVAMSIDLEDNKTFMTTFTSYC